MAKKAKLAKRKKSANTSPSSVDRYIALISHQIFQEEHFQQGLKLMEAGKWEEAGKAFQVSIDMGDCLPQPWGNLGIALMMQERYDEAEAALKRAIAMDPTYTLAKNNLAALPEMRRSGPPDMLGISDPFKHAKLKQSITFIRE